MKKTFFLLMAVVVGFIGGLARVEGAPENRPLTDICKQAVINKGYQEGYQFQHVEGPRPVSGGYTVTGQIANGPKRFDFYCNIDSDMKVREVGLSESTSSTLPKSPSSERTVP